MCLQRGQGGGFDCSRNNYHLWSDDIAAHTHIVQLYLKTRPIWYDWPSEKHPLLYGICQVCGSDGLTYGSPCSLTEESVRRELSPKLPELTMDYWGPCKEVRMSWIARDCQRLPEIARDCQRLPEIARYCQIVGLMMLQAPIIITPPTDTRGHVGANLTLDCEARGFPAPTISWQVEL